MRVRIRARYYVAGSFIVRSVPGCVCVCLYTDSCSLLSFVLCCFCSSRCYSLYQACSPSLLFIVLALSLSLTCSCNFIRSFTRAFFCYKLDHHITYVSFVSLVSISFLSRLCLFQR